MSNSSQDMEMCAGACGPHGANGVTAPGDQSAVGRRTFIVQSALLAAAAALAACSAGSGIAAPALPSGTPSTVNVNSYPALANVGGVAMVTVSGAELAIVRTSASSFVALSRICPHQGGTVQQWNNGFECPIHGAQFSQTGQWTGGQRTSNLHSYATTYDAATGTLSIS
ncbi:MAG: Rieske (2Fe-2S) protein [Gemmatimonadaceae bacterium]